MIKKLLSFALLFFLFACGSSDDGPAPYDPVAQLEVDIQLIDQYLISQNIQAQVHSSGMRYVIHEEGQGVLAPTGKRVFVHYDTYLLDGTFIDTSKEQTARDNGIFNSNKDYRPFDFVIGNGGVIDGFSLGTELLKEGGSGTFYIPSVLAYRDQDLTTIPPNSNLIFNITLVEIQN